MRTCKGLGGGSRNNHSTSQITSSSSAAPQLSGDRLRTSDAEARSAVDSPSSLSGFSSFPSSPTVLSEIDTSTHQTTRGAATNGFLSDHYHGQRDVFPLSDSIQAATRHISNHIHTNVVSSSPSLMGSQHAPISQRVYFNQLASDQHLPTSSDITDPRYSDPSDEPNAGETRSDYRTQSMPASTPRQQTSHGNWQASDMAHFRDLATFERSSDPSHNHYHQPASPGVSTSARYTQYHYHHSQPDYDSPSPSLPPPIMSPPTTHPPDGNDRHWMVPMTSNSVVSSASHTPPYQSLASGHLDSAGLRNRAETSQRQNSSMGEQFHLTYPLNAQRPHYPRASMSFPDSRFSNQSASSLSSGVTWSGLPPSHGARSLPISSDMSPYANSRGRQAYQPHPHAHLPQARYEAHGTGDEHNHPQPNEYGGGQTNSTWRSVSSASLELSQPNDSDGSWSSWNHSRDSGQ